MADEEQLRLLKQGVEAWDREAWIAWRREARVPVGLRKADLYRADLHGVDIRGVRQ